MHLVKAFKPTISYLIHSTAFMKRSRC